MSGPRIDVLVVGGGPAGLAVATHAAVAGARVVVLDHASPPVDKACGEGLMPDGVLALRRLSAEPAPGDYAVFRGIRWIDGPTVVEGTFPDQPGLGVRRTVLHRALATRAEAAGVELRWGQAVSSLENDNTVRTRAGERLRARWVVAADGLRSPLRAKAGLNGRASRHARLGLRRHYAVGPWTDRVEVYWSDRAEAYVTPVSTDRVGVALLSGRTDRPRFDALLGEWPELHARLEGAAIESRDRGAGPLRQRARSVVRGSLALVGDAAGYVDPITGEGLSVALHQAEALATALTRGDLSTYPADYRKIMALPNAMTNLVLAVERRPWLRRRVMRVLAATPELFDRLLAVHVRAVPPRRVGVDVVARLLWRTLIVGT